MWLILLLPALAVHLIQQASMAIFILRPTNLISSSVQKKRPVLNVSCGLVLGTKTNHGQAPLALDPISIQVLPTASVNMYRPTVNTCSLQKAPVKKTVIFTG